MDIKFSIRPTEYPSNRISKVGYPVAGRVFVQISEISGIQPNFILPNNMRLMGYPVHPYLSVEGAWAESQKMNSTVGQVRWIPDDGCCAAAWLRLRDLHPGAPRLRSQELNVHVPHPDGGRPVHPSLHPVRVSQAQAKSKSEF